MLGILSKFDKLCRLLRMTLGTVSLIEGGLGYSTFLPFEGFMFFSTDPMFMLFLIFKVLFSKMLFYLMS